MTTIPTITKAPEKWPAASERCYYHGKLMDFETAAFIMSMESELGYQLTVVQGCYATESGDVVHASAGTHDGGGVFDLEPFDYPRKVKVARSLGGRGSWHRTMIPGVWEEHIHTVIGKHPTLALAAKQQQVYFDQKPRKDGLTGEAVDPDQYPTKWPAPTFHYPPKAPTTPTFQTVSLNDDWGNKASDVVATVEAVRPLVMGVQEGWRVRYRDVIAQADPKHPHRFKVRQKLANKATAGVAVIWDTRRLTAIGHSGNPSRRGGGWQAIGKGADTRMRGVSWQDVAFKPGVEHGDLPPAFRDASVHRPPMRNRSSWARFDAKLALWMKHSPLPVVLFMDSNEHLGPHPLLEQVHSGYEFHHFVAPDGEGSIDGCLTDLSVKRVTQGPKRTSDHLASIITLG